MTGQENEELDPYESGYEAGYGDGVSDTENSFECDGDCGAYEDGHSDGYDDGYAVGFESGEESGTDKAFNNGYDDGKKFVMDQLENLLQEIERHVNYGAELVWLQDGALEDRTAEEIIYEIRRVFRILEK